MQAPAGFLIRCPVGRLVTTRAVQVRSVEEARSIRAAVGQAIMGRASGVIMCTDWRAIRVFAPEVADALLDMFKGTNARVIRGALLLPSGNATFGLQLERLLREAGNSARRAFRDTDAMLAWLGEVLDDDEARSAAEFLGAEAGNSP